MEDTIAAIATAPGEGGIAIVRVSGSQAQQVVSKVFRPKSGASIADLPGYTVHYGEVGPSADSAKFGFSEPVDDALITVFRAPRSYTREDVFEIACHGGAATTSRVLSLVLQAGARLAQPGEFTLRAFLNGRLDLAQAEAVADLIRARTESSRRIARRQLGGDVSKATARIREDLIGIVAAIEASIDFSDEVGELDYQDIKGRISRSLNDTRRLLSTADRGRLLREGLTVAIVGRPNVGKSSLLNAILRADRAIVTPIAGTTRDTIEESISIRGLPVVLTDTAGIRDTEDAVEQFGVDRTLAAVTAADVVMLVLDAAAGLTPADITTARQVALPADGIVVLNKCDLVEPSQVQILIAEAPSKLGRHGARTFAVSATTGSGIDQLEEALAVQYEATDSGITSSSIPIASVIVSSARHALALEEACNCLTLAAASAQAEMPGDFIAIDVRGALDALGQITGTTVTEDIIHRIFKDFCVGK